MIAASGGRTASGVERLLGRVGGGHLEARVAQDDPQRAEDLALVVHHEHARRRRSRRGRGRVRRGSWITKLVPWPGSDSALMRPPFASRKPRAIASPSPDPEPSSPETRWNGSNTRSRSSLAIPGPRSEIRISICLFAGPRADRHRLVAGEAGRVLQHVGQRPLELRGVGVDRAAAPGRAGGRSPPAGRGHGGDGRADHLVHADPVRRGCDAARPGAG